MAEYTSWGEVLVERGSRGVFVRTGIVERTVALDEERADFPVGVEAETVFFAEEIAEGEFGVVLGLGAAEGEGGGGCGRGAQVEDGGSSGRGRGVARAGDGGGDRHGCWIGGVVARMSRKA